MRFEHFPIMNRGEFGIERYDPDTNKVLIGGRGNVPRDAGTDAAKPSCSRRASGWLIARREDRHPRRLRHHQRPVSAEPADSQSRIRR